MGNRDFAKSFKKFCPKCEHFQQETGVCRKFYFNVRDYPNQFIKKCNGDYFNEDKTKVVQEIDKLDTITELDNETEIFEEAHDNSDEDIRFVTVFQPENEYEHLTAISLLENAGIIFYSKNAQLRNLFGIGQIGSGYNLVTGPIQIQVAEKNYEKAQKVLFEEDILKGFGDYQIPELCPACGSQIKDTSKCPECGLALIPSEDSDDYEEKDEGFLDKQKEATSIARKSVIYSLLWILGIGSALGIYYGIKSLQMVNSSSKATKVKTVAIGGIIFGLMGLLGSFLQFFY